VYVSSTLTTSSLSVMVQWGLDGGRAMMDLRRTMAPFSVVDVDGRLDERLRFGLTLRSWVRVKRRR
jgi:hypothetical protein